MSVAAGHLTDAIISRRSRMCRTSTGKRLALTDRDIEIFRTLARYRYLRSNFIHTFVGGASETRFKERLGDLFHEGYLDRPQEQWRLANNLNQPVVHELGKGARHVLSEAGIGDDEQRTWLRDIPHRQFEHSLMVCEILASIDLGIREHPGLRMIAWPEILVKAPEATRKSDSPFRMTVRENNGSECKAVVPDAVFGIEYQGTDRKLYRFFALEADRGTMPVARSNKQQSSFMGKLATYREAFANQVHKTQLGLPNLLVLSVTNSEQRQSEIMRRLEVQTGDNSTFLFNCLVGTAQPEHGALLGIWTRVGAAPVHLFRV